MYPARMKCQAKFPQNLSQGRLESLSRLQFKSQGCLDPRKGAGAFMLLNSSIIGYRLSQRHVHSQALSFICLWVKWAPITREQFPLKITDTGYWKQKHTKQESGSAHTKLLNRIQRDRRGTPVLVFPIFHPQYQNYQQKLSILTLNIYSSSIQQKDIRRISIILCHSLT